MFLANFIFVVSHLKIHPVHLKSTTPLQSKEKFIKSLRTSKNHKNQ